MSQGNREETSSGGGRRNYKILAVLLVVIISVAAVGTYITTMLGSETKPTETKPTEIQSPQTGVQYNLPTNPTIIQYAVEGGYVILSLAEIQSNGYVIFDYTQAGETIPMMAYLAPSGSIFTAIRFCTPCESESFWFDKDQAVCDVCGTRWYAETWKGISGVCTEAPPAKVENTVSGSNLIISVSSIQALKPREEISDIGTEPGSALRLIVVVPSTITQGQVTPIEVKAIGASGKLDPLREDVVKVSVGQGNAMLRDPAAESKKWAKEVTVELSKGVATIEILDEIQEVSKLSVVWTSGQSYLEPASTGVICVGQH